MRSAPPTPPTPDDRAEAAPTAVRQPVPAQPGAASPTAAPSPAGTGSSPTLSGPSPVRLTDVLPVPAHVQPDPAADFTLPADAVIQVDPDPAALAVAGQLAALLRPATGWPLPVTATTEPRPDHGIALVLTDEHGADDPASTAEGYRLDVTPTGVRISAATPAGLFFGVQTLRQLLPAAVEAGRPTAGPWVLPGGRIADAPRFPYRGAMLDVVRHFFPVADVLRFIDHLALYKLNHLHLHLTDDQGWRIAVDAWPRLGPVGGASQVGGGAGGHYSQADYRRIVRYAAERHITVVPEIDLPGHTHAALSAYGHLAPDGLAPPPYTGTEVGFSTLALADERTYDFVADVLGELAALTPGPYLHIGGDEAFTVAPEPYSAFVARAQALVAERGKTPMGWHQLAPAEHAEGRVLQYWGTVTDDPVVADAVRRGARLVLSPGNRTYLDMKYAPDTPIGHHWAGLIDVRQAYDWDPGSYLEGVPAEAVLGVEAPLWTESVTSLAEIEFMLLPRLPAIAELGWSSAARHDWPDFRRRLAGQGPRWRAAGITFHPSPEVPWPPTPTPPVPAPRSAAAQSRADQPGTPPR